MESLLAIIVFLTCFISLTVTVSAQETVSAPTLTTRINNNSGSPTTEYICPTRTNSQGFPAPTVGTCGNSCLGYGTFSGPYGVVGCSSGDNCCFCAREGQTWTVECCIYQQCGSDTLASYQAWLNSVCDVLGYDPTGFESGNCTVPRGTALPHRIMDASGTRSTSGSSGLSTGAAAGIGVGVALGVLAVVALAVLLLWRRRRQRTRQTPFSAQSAYQPVQPPIQHVPYHEEHAADLYTPYPRQQKDREQPSRAHPRPLSEEHDSASEHSGFGPPSPRSELDAGYEHYDRQGPARYHSRPLYELPADDYARPSVAHHR